MLVKYCFWTTGKYRIRSVIHVLLGWITNFFLSSMELCRTVIRKSSIRDFVGGLDIQNFDKKLPICRACYFNLGGLEVLFGGFSPQKPALGWREWNFVMVRICFLILFGMTKIITHHTDVWLCNLRAHCNLRTVIYKQRVSFNSFSYLRSSIRRARYSFCIIVQKQLSRWKCPKPEEHELINSNMWIWNNLFT